MLRRRYPALRCDHCGHFMGRVFDQYTNYGSATDLEPPDAVFVCEACHWRELITMVEREWTFKTWRASDAQRMGAAINRHLRRHPERREAVVAELRARAA